MYFFGAAHAFIDSGVLYRWQAEGKRIRFAGSSAGALAAACLACGQHDFESVMEFVLDKADDYRSSLFNLLKMRAYLAESIDVFGKNLRALDWSATSNRRFRSGVLEMSVTTLPKLQCRMVNSFHSYAQLRETLFATCCMVPLAGVPFPLRETGEWVVDGGISCFTPRVGEPNCISVSAMYFQDASVHPRVFVPSWWGLRPPTRPKYRNLFWMGYNDTIDFFVSSGILEREVGQVLLKPEVDFRVHDSYFDMAFTFVAELTILIWIRPVVIVCIYVELLFSMVWHTLRMIAKMDRHAFHDWVETLRQAISLRSLGRLLFGQRVPNNEERLSKRSRVFRLFEPIALGGERRTGRECWSPAGSPTSAQQPLLSPVTRRTKKFTADLSSPHSGSAQPFPTAKS